MEWTRHQEWHYQEIAEASNRLRVVAREAEAAFEHAEEEFYRVTAARSRLYRALQSMHAWHPAPMYPPPWSMSYGGWPGYSRHPAPMCQQPWPMWHGGGYGGWRCGHGGWHGYPPYPASSFAPPASPPAPASSYDPPSMTVPEAAPTVVPQTPQVSPAQQASGTLQDAQPAQNHHGSSIPQPSAHPTWGPVTPLLSRWEEGVMARHVPAAEGLEALGEEPGFDEPGSGYNAAPPCLAHSLARSVDRGRYARQG